MEKAGAHPAGVAIMGRKAGAFAVRIDALTSTEALILKQEALASGADAAISAGIVARKTDETAAVIAGSLPELERLAEKLRRQPFGLKDAGNAVIKAIENYMRAEFTLECAHGVEIKISRPVIMGIVNVTPDSFSDGGMLKSADAAVEFGLKLTSDGADILDVGGESTRPGAEDVNEEEELRRVIPVIKGIRERSAAAISIDTSKSAVAEAAIEAGANIINDVYACSMDPRMKSVAAQTGAGLILMHMRGTPRTMQVNPEYSDLIREVAEYLRDAADAAVAAGVDARSIAVDPGIGFGKTLAQNLELMARIGEFRSLGFPVLAGPSRKSWIGKLLGRGVADRLASTAAAAAALVMRGASIIRVHDVRECRDAVLAAWAIKSGTVPAEAAE
jgi:dihydropteroate synthase